MTATTIPEEIVPSSLLAYTGQDFTEVVVGGMPNGDDYLQVNHAAGSNKQKAWQPRRLESHLLRRDPDVNTLSFWIRRKQNLTGASTATPFGASTTGGATGPASVMFGVGGAAAASGFSGAAQALGWFVHPYAVDKIQLGVSATISSRLFVGTGPITLPLDTWVFVVVSLSTAADDLNRGTLWWYVDGVAGGATTPYAYWGYWIDTRYFSGLDTARFAIGDPTMNEKATRGVGDGPLYDLGKLAFHDQFISAPERLALIESMTV